jgi:hypothetical protein
MEKYVFNQSYYIYEQDANLIKGVAQFGRSWTMLAAALLPGRTGPQCKVRWDNTLNPDTKAGTWTQEEVNLI